MQDKTSFGDKICFYFCCSSLKISLIENFYLSKIRDSLSCDRKSLILLCLCCFKIGIKIFVCSKMLRIFSKVFRCRNNSDCRSVKVKMQQFKIFLLDFKYSSSG